MPKWLQNLWCRSHTDSPQQWNLQTLLTDLLAFFPYKFSKWLYYHLCCLYVLLIVCRLLVHIQRGKGVWCWDISWPCTRHLTEKIMPPQLLSLLCLCPSKTGFCCVTADWFTKWRMTDYWLTWMTCRLTEWLTCLIDGLPDWLGQLTDSSSESYKIHAVRGS